VKVLYREFREVGQDAERVMLVAKIRIGEELERAPVNKGGGDHRSPQRTGAPPTIAEQVGSKQRGIRLKSLAAVGKAVVLAAAETLWAKGKEATQSAVLKLIAGNETKARREASRSAAPLADGMELRIGDCRKLLADIPDNPVGPVKNVASCNN
jgi:hypothetical protein